MLALLSAAELLGMSLWFSATAVTPSLAEAFALSATQTAWLTVAVQAGFVAATLATAMANLADVVDHSFADYAVQQLGPYPSR